MRLPHAFALLCFVTACGDRAFEPCDIREQQCQTSLISALQGLRAPTVVDAEITVHPIAELEAEATSDITDEERRSFAVRNDILALFDFSEPGVTLEQRSVDSLAQTAAFYSSDLKRVTIIDRDQPANSPSTCIIFVHEIVHAMQDADGLIELALTDNTTTDLSLARRAVIEGEASMFDDLAALDLYGWDMSNERYQRGIDDTQARQNAQALSSPKLLYDSRFLFAYAHGTEYVRNRWNSDGMDGVRSIYSALPSTTREIVRDSARRAFDVAPLGADAIATFETPSETVIEDSFGEWLFYTWLGRELPAYVPEDLELIDDAFTGTVLSDGSRAAVWRLRFATRGMASSFAIAMRSHTHDITVIENDVVVTRTSSSLAANVTGWRAMAAR